MSDHHPRDQKTSAGIALIITSDSRTKENDKTGQTAIQILEKAEHTIQHYAIVPNDSEKIKKELEQTLQNPDIQVIITSGGTGISPRDKTVDTVTKLFDKTIPGFGEHFRRLSYEEIGVSSVMSRATAGIAKKKIIFCLPGSRGAMTTALNQIILPAIGHMLWELKRE